MTPNGRTFALMRLADAPDLEALKTVWSNLSIEYQKDEVVRDMKDALKQKMEKES
ncbi:hypothetical protein [Roseovarius sp.]|uniref:hypothetical protein n=1 Tax=Roseovarius sp. TaxID=1486281 RepID=UPI003BAA8516